MLRKLFVITCIMLLRLPVMAQFTYGTTGLLHMPTADMQQDKTFMAGGGYFDKHATPDRWSYNTWNYYINITFFPWLEVAYTCTIFDEMRGSVHMMNQDRNFSGRLRLWKEGWWKKWTPQIVIGLDDPGSHESYGGGEIISGNTGSSNNYATRYYIAATKHFEFETIGKLGVHVAYIYGKAKGIPEYKRPAAGVNFRLSLIEEKFYQRALNGFNFMAEYDARTVNLGFNYAIWKDRINLLCAWNECKHFSGGIQFKICLK